MNILEFPADILYQIFKAIDVNDLLTLRKTCKAFQKTTRERSVWHQALFTRLNRNGLPIPGLRQRHLSDLTDEDLERLTIRSDRFWSNWTSPTPTWYTHITVRESNHGVAGSRNLAAQFLPGRGSCYLLTLTLQSDRTATDSLRCAFECWDISNNKPLLVANLLVSGLLGYAFNTVPDSRHMLAVNRRDVRRQYIVTTYTLDLTDSNTNPWFREVNQFDGLRHTLGLDRSYFIATDTHKEVCIINADTGRLLYYLKDPSTHADPMLRLADYDCLDFESIDGFILTFCQQWIFLYRLPPVSDGVEEDVIRLDPVAAYHWPWRISTISVSRKRHGPISGSHYTMPIIDILVRIDTWPHALHHFVLQPNAAYTSPSAPTHTLPYLASTAVADVPFLMHSLPSPVRLFTPLDMVLGPRGTAIWLGPCRGVVHSQAGSHGQRIALKVLSETPIAATMQNSQVSLDINASVTRVKAEDVAVLHERHEMWNRVAVNEDEGLVAVGYTDGRVSVFSYAPPLENVGAD